MPKAPTRAWMPMYWGDYMRDTGRLGVAAHGAYMLLLKEAWISGGKIPDNDEDLFRITCCDDMAQWMALRPKVEGFFTIADGFWRNSRIEKELKRSNAVSKKKSEAGRRGAAKRWQMPCESHADANGEPVANGSQTYGLSQPQPHEYTKKSARDAQHDFAEIPDREEVALEFERVGFGREHVDEFMLFWAERNWLVDGRQRVNWRGAVARRAKYLRENPGKRMSGRGLKSAADAMSVDKRENLKLLEGAGL